MQSLLGSLIGVLMLGTSYDLERNVPNVDSLANIHINGE